MNKSRLIFKILVILMIALGIVSVLFGIGVLGYIFKMALSISWSILIMAIKLIIIALIIAIPIILIKKIIKIIEDRNK